MMEALACHPLDTIKVRMQLSRRARAPGVGLFRYTTCPVALHAHSNTTRLTTLLHNADQRHTRPNDGASSRPAPR